MTISDKTLREMLKTVESQSIYGETSKSSWRWFFDCGVRTAISTLECAIWKEEKRLTEEEQHGTTA